MKALLISIAVAVVIRIVGDFLVKVWADCHKIAALYEEYPLWLYFIAFISIASEIVAVVCLFRFLFSL